MPAANGTPKATNVIAIAGVRSNNLKNSSLDIPKNQLVVVSGLGK